MSENLKSELATAIGLVNEIAGKMRETGVITANNWREKMGAMISGTYDAADTLHNIYLDFGYPLTLQFSEFWNMYRRFGIAKNIVDLPVSTCWESLPKVIENERLAADIERLDSAVKFWSRIRSLDTRQRVGRYAAMFMRVRDNKKPEEPLTGKLGGLAGLVQMVPMYEGQLTVLDTEDDPTSPNYGNPTMYQFNGGNTGNRDNQTPGTFNIHPSRIVIAAEGADNGGIYGIPALEACYNSLMDLRKIIGSGGEGFYKSAAQSVVFELQDATAAQQNASLLAEFNDNFDDFARNRGRRGLWTPGLKPSVLSGNLSNSDSHFNSALSDIAASAQIPATILIGKQTGRLASDEDSKAFRASMNSRRADFLTEMIADVITWCQKYGILPSGEYSIEWDDLLATSQAEKLDNASKMAEVNQKQFNAGQNPAFDSDEIREAAGYEIEDMPAPDETLPDDINAEE